MTQHTEEAISPRRAKETYPRLSLEKLQLLRSNINPQARYSCGEALAFLGLRPTRFFGKVKRGEIKVVRDGKCARVLGAELRRAAAESSAQ